MRKITLTLLAGTVLLVANVALATEQPTAQDCPTISQIGTTKSFAYYYFSAINNAGKSFRSFCVTGGGYPCGGNSTYIYSYTLTALNPDPNYSKYVPESNKLVCSYYVQGKAALISLISANYI